MISWKHTEVDLAGADKGKKIDIFYEKIWGWTLYPASLIINGGATHDGSAGVCPIPHSGFACLQVVLSYFEMIGSYVEGETSRGKSEKLFIRGVRYVFPELDEMPYFATQQFLSTLYVGGRCGLYHMSMTGKGIAIGGGSLPVISYDNSGKQVIINPHRLPEALIKNLKTYCDELRSVDEKHDLWKKFKKRFDEDNPEPKAPAGAAAAPSASPKPT